MLITILRIVAYILIAVRLVAFVIEENQNQNEVTRLEAIRDQLEEAYQEQKLLNKAA